MTQISKERVAELLGWQFYQDPNQHPMGWWEKGVEFVWDIAEHARLPDFHTDPAWTGPLLERYQLATAEPYLDKVLSSLSKWAYKLSADDEMKLNEVIIVALDALEEK